MSQVIPKLSSHCVHCHRRRVEGTPGPCEDHRRKDGSVKEYRGPDLYHPNDWVKNVLTGKYKGPDGRIYRVMGYDPRCGFFLEAEGDPPRVTDISDRAIGRTFHRLPDPV
jgi:hypothetical protein